FKRVNDEHGHDVGDKVLQEAAYRLRSSLRAFDSVYRIGGEEFVVLLTDVDPDGATETANRIAEAVRAAPLAGVPVTISLGVASSTPSGDFDYDRTFARADAALYAAKENGRDRVVCADPRTGELLAA
ncbi:MAG: GGDEF domain-containing protein, partial [Solirubrobacteraceae bacterium]|nr:GGDEF domain-containing protein [Solirubrobacteraceae bacterium]